LFYEYIYVSVKKIAAYAQLLGGHFDLDIQKKRSEVSQILSRREERWTKFKNNGASM